MRGHRRFVRKKGAIEGVWWPYLRMVEMLAFAKEGRGAEKAEAEDRNGCEKGWAIYRSGSGAR